MCSVDKLNDVKIEEPGGPKPKPRIRLPPTKKPRF